MLIACISSGASDNKPPLLEFKLDMVLVQGAPSICCKIFIVCTSKQALRGGARICQGHRHERSRGTYLSRCLFGGLETWLEKSSRSRVSVPSPSPVVFHCQVSTGLPIYDAMTDPRCRFIDWISRIRSLLYLTLLRLFYYYYYCILDKKLPAKLM